MATELRAAIDLGSGSTKLLIAEVDPEARRVVREVVSLERVCSFSLSSKRNLNGELSEEVKLVS